MNNHFRIYFLLFFIFCSSIAHSQFQVVKGIVYKANTGTPLEFANVYVKASTFGTITDLNGKFVLRVPVNVTEIYVSAIGYITTKIPISDNPDSLVVEVEEDVINIDEVVVSLGKNPALAIHDSILKYKRQNDPDNVNAFKARVYEKEVFLFTALDTSLIENVFFRKYPGAFIKMKEDDSLLSFPVYKAERIKDIYKVKDPYKERVELIAENKDGVNVIKGPEVSSLIGTIQTNFYNNHLFLLDKDFLSPLAITSKLLYNYYLVDTVLNYEGDTLFKVKFKPKLLRDLLLIGHFWYNAKTHGITEVEARIHQRANLNFIQNVEITKSYQYVDSAYFWGDEKLLLDFVYSKRQDSTVEHQTIRSIKTTSYNDVRLKNLDDEVFAEQDKKFELIQKKNAFYRDTTFWNENRPIERDSLDIVTENSLQVVNDIGLIKVGDWFADMFLNGWMNAGFMEIGPWESLFRSNEIEGFRYTFSARLAPKISKRFLVAAFVAYGSKDKKWKYGGSLGYALPTTKYQIIKGKIEDNVITMGNYKNNISYIRENLFVRTEDNIFGNLLLRSDNYKLYHLFESEIQYDKEWMPGVYTQFIYNYFEHKSGEFIPFTLNDEIVNTIVNQELSFHLRLTKNEQVVNNYFRRVYYLTKSPRLHILGSYGRYNFNSTSGDYFHLRSVVEHYYPIGFGKLGYIIEAGTIFGNVPYPLLEIPRGNESYGYSRFNFNLLNIMEYANDTYVNLMLEYQTNGFFLNRIPIIRALKLRESFTAKMMYGNLRNGHRNILDLPEQINELDGFYAEVGVGVTNLLKCIRLHNTWRLTDTEKGGVLKYIFQIGLQIEF